MDTGYHKHYHLDNPDSRDHHNRYFSPTSEKYFYEEIVKFPCETLHKMCVAGEIKGDTLIDLSAYSAGLQLFPLCDVFSEIIVLKCDDSSIKEMNKWLNQDADALDWMHLSQLTSELKGDRAKNKQEEETLRKKMKFILKCDFSKENLTDPVLLQKADCFISAFMLNAVCESTDACHRLLRKMASMIKLGGTLLLIGFFNSTFYSVSEAKYRLLAFDEQFLRKSMDGAGFVTKRLDRIKSKICSHKLHYEHMWVLRAVKEKEV
uniref:Nicotinamide N-methyltransferase n=1 Tax=Leptobrachium leishanense TaxID=445787 RepID=A0A8C5WMC5_9ANUR